MIAFFKAVLNAFLRLRLVVSEREAYENYLAGASSLADLELRQRLWERRAATRPFLGMW